VTLPLAGTAMLPTLSWPAPFAPHAHSVHGL